MNSSPSIDQAPTIRLPALLQDVLLWRDPVGQLRKWAEVHGTVFTVTLPATGPMLFVGGESAARQVLVSDPHEARAGAATGRVLPVLGPSCVLRQDGDAHKDRRRLIGSAFHGASLARLRSIAADNADREIQTWAEGKAIALLPRMQKVVFATIAAVVLGVNDPTQAEVLRQGLARMTGPSALARTWMFPAGDGATRSWLSRHAQRRQELVGSLLTSLVDARRAGPPSEENDVLGLLIGHERQSGLRMAEADMNDELLALLLAGYETTSAALAWALERLAREPAMALRLRESLRGDDPRYLSAFIHEILRWRPPVVDAVRELTNPMDIEGYRIPAGTLLVVAPLLVHDRATDPASPDTFQPSRFLGDAAPTRDWIPFGGGRRYCLGADLAVLELEVVLTRIVRAVTLSATTRRSESARLLGTVMVPSRGSVAVISRHPSPVVGLRGCQR